MSFSIPSKALESSFGEAFDQGSYNGILFEINYTLDIRTEVEYIEKVVNYFLLFRDCPGPFIELVQETTITR
jgi:hypothetical protein